MLRGAVIYTTGDTLAAILLGEFSPARLLGMMLIGGTLYAWEIPHYFAWIEKKTAALQGVKKSLAKTALAILYFNPLWIFRHLLFIKIFSGAYAQVLSTPLLLLHIATMSFLVNIPISMAANYLIQNIIKLPWRFTASAIFSALMAVYYALSETLFGNL